MPVWLTGILFASGRPTVTTWARAAGISDDYPDYYYFLTSAGRNTNPIAWQLVTLVLRRLPLPERLLLVIDDSPTKGYGPKVEGADIHHIFLMHFPRFAHPGDPVLTQVADHRKTPGATKPYGCLRRP